MGDIYKKVKICGLAQNGKKMACQTVSALLDTGEPDSVIGRKLAKELGGMIVRPGNEIEGRIVPTMASWIQVLGVDCGPQVLQVVVDDALAARAGSKAQMILGNDCMQRTRLALLMSTREDDEGVACRWVRAEVKAIERRLWGSRHLAAPDEWVACRRGRAPKQRR